MLAKISDLPHTDKAERQQFYDQLRWASIDPSDILNPSGAGSTDDEIKKAFGG